MDEYRSAGLADPFFNELFVGRINQDWLNPYPTIEDDREVEKLMARRGDLADKLVSIEELEDNALEKLKRLNIMNLDHHFDIDGAGMSEMEAMHVTEILSKDLALLSTFRFTKNFGIKALLYGAEDEVLEKYLQDCTDLKRTIGFCLTEPEARSDISSLQTRAYRDPEDPDLWLISGKKSRVLVHPNTDLFIVFAQTQRSPEESARLTAFLVDLKNVKGEIEVTSGEQDMKIDGLTFANVTFHDVSCHSSHILGELGEGFHLAYTLQCLNRYSIGAEFAEMQRSMLQLMAKYCHITEQFGKRLDEFPLVRARLSRITENAYMCESISYLVGGKMTDIESGSDFSLYASECAAVQLKCKELALDTINNCIELLGTRAFAPNSRIIFDNLMNVYATCAMSGSSDVLSLQLAQAGIQYRYHFDNSYFMKNRGSDWRDGAFRQRTFLKWRDSRDEYNNFTDQWKSIKGVGVKDSYFQGALVSIIREALGAKMWGRLVTSKKLTGLLGGRWNGQLRKNFRVKNDKFQKNFENFSKIFEFLFFVHSKFFQLSFFMLTSKLLAPPDLVLTDGFKDYSTKIFMN